MTGKDRHKILNHVSAQQCDKTTNYADCRCQVTLTPRVTVITNALIGNNGLVNDPTKTI